MLSARSFRFLVCRLRLAVARGAIVFTELSIGVGVAISVGVSGAQDPVCYYFREGKSKMRAPGKEAYIVDTGDFIGATFSEVMEAGIGKAAVVGLGFGAWRGG